MSWARLDDSYCDHPKIVKAGNEAAGLHVRAIAYCAKHSTDGFIGHETVRMFCNGNGDDLAQKLCVLGLFHAKDGGYMVHDFLDYNPTAKEVNRERIKAVKRMRTFRKRSGNVRANKQRSSVYVRRTPGRDGTGESSSESSLLILPDPDARDTFVSVWQRYPNHRGRSAAEAAWTKANLRTEEIAAIHAALTWQLQDPEWLRDGGQYVPRLSSYLHQRRWRDEPCATPVVNDVTAHNLAAMAKALK